MVKLINVSSLLIGLVICCFLFDSAYSFGLPMPNRESRALTPSVNSWCMFYPERCRMLRFGDANRRPEFD